MATSRQHRDGFEDILLTCSIGTPLHIPNAHPIEAPTQHLRPSSLQRLLRGLLPLVRNIRLPATTLDSEQSSIQLGTGSQDVSSISSSSFWCYSLLVQRYWSQFQAGLVNGPAPGCHRMAIPTSWTNVIPQQSLRVLAAIPLQMDSQLAIRRRGQFFEQGVLDSSFGRSYQYVAAIYHNKMAATSRKVRHGIDLGCIGFQRASGKDAARLFYSNLAELHLDNHPDSLSCWYALCQILALSVLRLHCLGDSFPALAKWSASHPSVWTVGGARMELECVSEYGYQLYGGSW